MPLNGRNVTLAEINKISFPELKFVQNQNPRKVGLYVAVSVNKVRVNRLYRVDQKNRTIFER